MRVRTLIKNDFQQAWQRFDLLLGPTAPTPAFPSGTKSADSQAMKLADLCTLPASLAGLPALSLPCGQTDGLPLGLQLIGRPMAEPTLLQTAYAYEQATDWHQLRPTLT
jgi:aspartyl-tRNA(Asn)/glutamyl-tRNA(Gln) amidotransferase subunit A